MYRLLSSNAITKELFEEDIANINWKYGILQKRLDQYESFLRENRIKEAKYTMQFIQSGLVEAKEAIDNLRGKMKKEYIVLQEQKYEAGNDRAL